MNTRSILAGVAIGIGGWAFLAVKGGALGAFLFSFGLIMVCMRGYSLYTGSVCRAGIPDAPQMLVIFLGNLIGILLVAIIARYSSPPRIVEYADAIVTKKLLEGWRVLPLGAFCNVLIFYAVDIWPKLAPKYKSVTYAVLQKPDPEPFVLYVATTSLCVVVFVLAGFEHSIANIFYMTVSGQILSLRALLYLLLNVLGNTIGGIAIYRINKGIAYARRV